MCTFIFTYPFLNNEFFCVSTISTSNWSLSKPNSAAAISMASFSVFPSYSYVIIVISVHSVKVFIKFLSKYIFDTEKSAQRICTEKILRNSLNYFFLGTKTFFSGPLFNSISASFAATILLIISC